MRSTIIGVALVGGLALAGCTASDEPSDAPPAPGTPPADAPQHPGESATSSGAPQETGTAPQQDGSASEEAPLLPTTP